MSSSDEPGDRVARIAAARERSCRSLLIRDLTAARLLTDPNDITFVGLSEMDDIIERARASGLQAEWRQRAGWAEIEPDLRCWLGGRARVVCGLTRVAAGGDWFEDRLAGLLRLWGDLYLYTPDGLNGFLVNTDSERGWETLVWGSPDG